MRLVASESPSTHHKFVKHGADVTVFLTGYGAVVEDRGEESRVTHPHTVLHLLCACVGIQVNVPNYVHCYLQEHIRTGD